MPLISTYTGQQQGFGTMCQQNFFGHYEGREQPMFQIARQGSTVRRNGTNTFKAASGNYIEDYGSWTNISYEVPERFIMKLFAKKNTGWGNRQIAASVFLMARDTAAVRRIRFPLAQDQRWVLQHVETQGRFDILTLEEAETYGVTTSFVFRRFHAIEEVNRAFEITEIEPEIASRPILQTATVVTHDGETHRVSVRQRRRALDL